MSSPSVLGTLISTLEHMDREIYGRRRLRGAELRWVGVASYPDDEDEKENEY